MPTTPTPTANNAPTPSNGQANGQRRTAQRTKKEKNGALRAFAHCAFGLR
jgi:hypothetical protein